MVHVYSTIIILVGCLSILQSVVSADRILGIFPFRSKSHYAVARKIMITLAARGHRVTVISGIAEKSITANFEHIDLSDKLPSFEDTVDISQDSAPGLIDLLIQIDDLESYMCEAILADERLKKAINDTADYDLLFVECYTVPCFLALGVKLNVPVIWYAAASTAKAHDYLTGNLVSPAIGGSIVNGFLRRPTFTQRLQQFYQHTLMFMHHLLMENKALEIFNRLNYDGDDVTKEQMQRKANLILSCQHPVLFPRPNVPGVIPIAGLHIEDVKPLPEDLRKFMEEAKHGVILFSIGTALKMSTLTKEKLNIFIETFNRIPQRILWRGDINITNLPTNVILRHWFPQSDVLAHENMRAFISHGGLHGIYETIHNAVPVVGIPFLYDQFSNIRSLEDKGVAIFVDHRTLTTERLIDAINRVLNDTSYKTKMDELSSVFRDVPMSPLDTAIYWTEYVLRHKGADHLKSTAAYMPLYRLLLLDVLAFILTLFVICVYMFYYFIYRKIIALFKRTNSSKMKKS